MDRREFGPGGHESAFLREGVVLNRILSRFAVICVIAALEGCAGTEMQVQAAYLPDPAAGISYLVSSNVDVPQNALGILRTVS